MSLFQHLKMNSPVVLTSAFVFITGCASLTSDYKPPRHQEVKLSNGLNILLIEDRKLPYVTFSFLINSGSSVDPKDKHGLAGLVVDLLDKGTQGKSAMQVAATIDDLGAQFSSQAGQDTAQVSIEGLAQFEAQLLDILAEILLQPAFSAEEIERQTARSLAYVQKAVDNASGFADHIFNQHMLPGHPYGHRTIGDEEGLKKIRQRDINRFYLQNFRPGNAWLAVVGNYSDDIVAKLEQRFRAWEARANDQLEALAPMAKFSGRSIQVVHKSDVKQSEVRIGLYGIRRKSKDYLAIGLANQILGGGFTSRLNQRLRDDLGLTYGVYSDFDALRVESPFTVSTSTRHEKIDTLCREAIKILENFHAQGVTQQELDEAKGLMRGRFPRQIETAEKRASVLLGLKAYEIDQKYLDNYLSDLAALKLAQVNQVIREHFNPESLKVLIYTNSKTAAQTLKDVAPVTAKSYRDFL